MEPQINPEGKNENANNKPDNPTPAALPDKDKAEQVEKKEERPAHETAKSNEEKPCCAPISVVDKTPDKWRKANIISLVAAGINIVVVVAYGLLFAQGQRAAEETKREFETSNRPFIELSDVKIDSFGAAMKPILSYKLTNKGRFPALVSSYKVYFGYAPKNTSVDTIIAYNKRTQLTNVDSTVGIIPFSPTTYDTRAASQIPLEEYIWAAIDTGSAVFTLVVDIKYTNLVTKYPYSYLQVLKISSPRIHNSTSVRYKDDPE